MLEALAFLTVIPVGSRARTPSRTTLIAFPLVGLLVGAMWAVVGWAGHALWGSLPAAALVLIADAGLTGALHLDAVADVADGWASRKPAEEALAVMRDPAIGAIGAGMLGATLLVRWSLLAALIARAAPAGHWWVLAVAPVIGRCAMVWTLQWAGNRPAGDAPRPPSLTDAWAGAGWRIAAGVAGLGGVVALEAGGVRGVLALALAGAAAWGAAAWARRRFGRVVGDVVGAAGMAAEVVALAVLSAGSHLH
ncbi:MAG TPA: adenosylcobinamide-GDP ribazoletransferase [Actinomycetota bacterium]|nr:adenosylcobinamide-GDP ribazoletransferase [Actinomycetota bacterium]